MSEILTLETLRAVCDAMGPPPVVHGVALSAADHDALMALAIPAEPEFPGIGGFAVVRRPLLPTGMAFWLDKQGNPVEAFVLRPPTPTEDPTDE